MPSRNGMFVPTWERQNHETGELEFGLDPDDFEAVRQGYGCASCLADFHGIYHLACPVCGEKRPQPQLVVGQWWTERSII